MARAKALGVFGTKMRSRVAEANEAGIKAIVEQQFEVAKTIIACGLCPIIEPEVDITTPNKAGAEKMLLDAMMVELAKLAPDQQVMLKLTIPDEDNLYTPCIEHPNVVRVVALSGGCVTPLVRSSLVIWYIQFIPLYRFTYAPTCILTVSSLSYAFRDADTRELMPTHVWLRTRT